MIDEQEAERRADAEWEREMAMLTPQQRGIALNNALLCFEVSLKQQGVWVGDVFARCAQLELALTEWHDRIAADLAKEDTEKEIPYEAHRRHRPDRKADLVP